ncbi:sugar phosphate isomerase/epimerase family protein [Rhodococcoides kyotonense]|uniref:Sugar phosphate isomerase/epimerase n=1 Tax=Rhodococcoides kyotonense TaxID=398843 RepID=A0A239I3S2_9NOCA|nr:TIM barrel protein [Rhodococcus kyotonensis]SNS86994.1 Sugar phosphate isomerase/epimerase [Rhodococcus kyotonensis]
MSDPASGRIVSLSHLSALHVEPPRLVELAAAGGFDAVSLRVAHTAAERGFQLPSGSTALRDTRSALADNGLRVLDVEVVKLHAGSVRGDWMSVLEAGAELGASYVLVTVLDEDHRRAGDTFANLAELAAEHGLRCCLEPMVFSSVRDMASASDFLAGVPGVDAGLLVDALHFERAGSTIDDLNPVSVERFPYFQICDAASAGPFVDLDTAVAEARTDRMAPGEGVLSLAPLVAALPSTAAVSVEVPSARGVDDPAGWIAHLGRTTREVLERTSVE